MVHAACRPRSQEILKTPGAGLPMAQPTREQLLAALGV